MITHDSCDIFHKIHSSSCGCRKASDKGKARGTSVSCSGNSAEMNVEDMKSMLRRRFSFGRIQRPRIAITRASMESQDYASTGELDIVRAIKVSP